MSVAMPEAVFDRAAAALDQGSHFLEDSRRILGMKTVWPRLRIGGHLVGRVAHDGAEILAHEGAREVARDARGVENGGARSEQELEKGRGAPLHRLFARLEGP